MYKFFCEIFFKNEGNMALLLERSFFLYYLREPKYLRNGLCKIEMKKYWASSGGWGEIGIAGKMGHSFE